MKRNNNPGEGLATIQFDSIDFEKYIDPEIKDLVLLLNKNNFQTFTSCQGGIKHSFKVPTIRMYLNETDDILLREKNRLNNFLKEKNYTHYDLSIVYSGPNTATFLELTFFTGVIRNSNYKAQK